MSMSTTEALKTEDLHNTDGSTKSFVTLNVAGQLFGIPILGVRDILSSQKITPVPKTTPHIEGLLNLRGLIVTVINVRECLNIPPEVGNSFENKKMNIVVESNGESYSLLVDSIGEVMQLDNKYYEKIPPTLDQNWATVASGVYRLEDRLLVVLDVESLLQIVKENNE